MKYSGLTPLAAAFLMVLSALPLRAQLVADGATRIINATGTNISGDLVIGTNGSLTSLVITNAGAVTNSGNGTIGLNATANTNQVIVTGPNSRWSMGGNLLIGSSGSSSLLVVTNA